LCIDTRWSLTVCHCFGTPKQCRRRGRSTLRAIHTASEYRSSGTLSHLRAGVPDSNGGVPVDGGQAAAVGAPGKLRVEAAVHRPWRGLRGLYQTALDTLRKNPKVKPSASEIENEKTLTANLARFQSIDDLVAKMLETPLAKDREELIGDLEKLTTDLKIASETDEAKIDRLKQKD
jgi:hypothetical protein